MSLRSRASIMTTNASPSLPAAYEAKNKTHVSSLSSVSLSNIDDLVAIPTDIEANQSIRRLLNLSEVALRQSEMSREFNRPAIALKDFIRASIIAIQVIPRHKDYHSLRDTGGDASRMHNALLKRISQQSGVYERIRRDIIQDSKKTGVQPTTIRRPLPPPLRNGDIAETNGHPQAPANCSPVKKKPAVHPKPQSLHGNTILQGQAPTLTASTSILDLGARFANLRGSQPSPGQDPRIKTYTIPTQRPAESRPLLEGQSLNVNTDTAASALPKLPDAIYSPARGSLSGEAARLPTSTPHGLFSRTGSASSASTCIGLQQDCNEYFPPFQKATTLQETDKAVLVPDGDSITARQLFEAMKSRVLTILLIDVRSREEFNEGHIMSRSTICIEPSVLLRENITTDEISESMVLSPNPEQMLFDQRHTWDLVVFYDQESQQIPQRAQNSDELIVLSLHRVLVHFNYGSDLKRRPRLLSGGFNAWIDLMGPNTVESSSAAAIPRHNRQGTIQRRGSKYVVVSLLPADVKAWETALEKDARQSASRPSFPRTGEEFFRSPPISSQPQSMSFPPVERISQDGLEHKVGSPNQLPSPPARPRAAVQRVSHSGLSQEDDTDEGSSEGLQRLTARYKKAAESPPGPGKLCTGLHNPSSWCYANSTLQSLFASPGFGRVLAESEWSATYKVPKKKTETIEQPQLMMRIISNLFHWMSTGTFETMKAQTLMDYSCHLCRSSEPNTQFGGSSQQDAQEFMSFIMDQLHDETNVHRDQPDTLPLPKTEGRLLVEAAREYWYGYTQSSQSIVDHYWRTLQLSTVECQTCKTRTSTFDPFGWISVPVNRGRDATLAEALNDYAAANDIPEFACDQCRSKQRAMQSMSLARMPPLLCIGFGRFGMEGSRVVKYNRAISWDLNDFDFSPYFLRTSETAAAKAADKAFCGPGCYECYAVVVHSGSTVSSGHYYAYVRDLASRDPYAWLLCNDSRVTRVRLGSGDAADMRKDVFRSGADRVPYLAFFRRKTTA